MTDKTTKPPKQDFCGVLETVGGYSVVTDYHPVALLELTEAIRDKDAAQWQALQINLAARNWRAGNDD